MPARLFFLCLAAAAALQFLEPLPIAPYSFEAGLIGGVSALLAGAGLGAWGIRELQRHRTALEPGSVPSRLVITGPFRFTRNPLYVALVTIAAGIAAMVNSAWFLAGTAILLLFLDRLVIRREESTMREVFGPAYDAYVSRARRWF